MTFPTDDDTLWAVEQTVTGQTPYALDVLLYFLSAYPADRLSEIYFEGWDNHPLYTYGEDVIYKTEDVIASLVQKIKENT